MPKRSALASPVGDHEIPQVGGVGDHVIPHPGDHYSSWGAFVSVPGLVLVRPQAPSSLPCSEVGSRPLARVTFDVIDIVEILVHWYAGRSQNELA